MKRLLQWIFLALMLLGLAIQIAYGPSALWNGVIVGCCFASLAVSRVKPRAAGRQ
jgi:hypothetical protein